MYFQEDSIFLFNAPKQRHSLRSQAFLIVGTLFLLPVIVGYTAWSYWVFRGKVRAEGGYH